MRNILTEVASAQRFQSPRHLAIPNLLFGVNSNCIAPSGLEVPTAISARAIAVKDAILGVNRGTLHVHEPSVCARTEVT